MDVLKVSWCIMTHDRIVEIIAALKSINRVISYAPENVEIEILVLLNGTDESLYNNFLDKVRNESFNTIIKILRSTENLGVAQGRNFLYKNSYGDVLIFIDDDAEIVLDSTCFWTELSRSFSQNMRTRKVGIVAFRSIDINGKDRIKEIPCKDPAKEQFVFHFIGVGHAILRTAIVEHNFLYPDNLYYGMEEYYLSYWIINNGYSIFYNPNICVLHKKSQKTRLNDTDYFIYLSSNKVYIAFLCFRSIIRFTFLIMWSIWLMKKTKFSLTAYIKFIKRLRELLNSHNTKLCRFTCCNETLKYIKELGGNLYY